MSSLKYLSTWFVFLLGVISFIFLPVFFYSTNLYYILLSFTLILSFIFGYLTSSLLNKNRIKIYTSKFDYRKYKYLILIGYLIYAYIFIFFIGAETGPYVDKYAHTSQLSLYMQLIDKPLKLVFLFLLSSIVYDSRRNYLLVSIIYLLISLTSNTRLDFVLSAIYWIGYGAYLGFFRIRLVYVIISLFLFPFLATILLIKRVMQFESNNIFDIFSELYEVLSIDTIIDSMDQGVEFLNTYSIGLSVINENFIHPMSGYIRIIFMWIPRTIWPTKPESVSRIIAKEYVPNAYFSGGGQTAGPIGDAFINAGVLGVVIIWFFTGFFSSKNYNILKSYYHIPPSNYKIYIWLIYFNFISYMVYVMRGFGSDFFWVFLFQLLVIKVMFYLTFKRHVK